jgi:uncharacterized membrane protein YcaP (DUF421 family)
MLVPDTPLPEIFIRGTIVYIALFAMLRFVLKRESGTFGITDLLVLVLIADAAQNAMSGDYQSVPDGVLLVAVIVFWAWAVDALSYRFPAVERLVKPRPLPLVREGRPLWGNLRKELVTMHELESQLREQGVEDIGQVKEARMESDGRLSVVTRDAGRHEPPEPEY